MIELMISELTRLGVVVLHKPDVIPDYVAQYVTSETNALYVKYGDSHQIYMFQEEIKLHVLAHEAIHFLQNQAKSTLAFCSEVELLVGFPQYWRAVNKAYKKATRKELLQETEAHVFQQYTELVLKGLQNA